MKIIMEIPDNDIPKGHAIISANLYFINGKLCQCTYPFIVLPIEEEMKRIEEEMKYKMENCCCIKGDDIE